MAGAQIRRFLILPKEPSTLMTAEVDSHAKGQGADSSPSAMLR